MEEGVPEAFCLLLWNASNHSQGKCSRPYDCRDCPLMQMEISMHAGQAIWVCPSCVSIVVKKAKKKGSSYILPGHYTEGVCQYKKCTRPPRKEGDVELPAGYSRLLQLFIGAIDG
jgi:hypothetical protein